MSENSASGGPPWRLLGCLAILLVALPTGVAVVVKLSYDSAFPGSPLAFEGPAPTPDRARLPEWRNRCADGQLASFPVGELQSWLLAELAHAQSEGQAGPLSRISVSGVGTRRIHIRLSWEIPEGSRWLAGRFFNLEIKGLLECEKSNWFRVEIDHYAFGQFSGTPERGEESSRILDQLAEHSSVPAGIQDVFGRIEHFQVRDRQVQIRLR